MTLRRTKVTIVARTLLFRTGVVHPAFALQPFVPEESLKKLPSPPRNEMLVVTFAEWTPSEGERRAEDVSLEHTKRRLLIEFYVKYRGLFIDCAHYMHKFFRVSPELCFVALHKQEIVGTIGASFVDDAHTVAWLAQFFVRADCRGSGVGKALWERLWTVLRGTPCIGLGSFRNNAHIGFYARYGFQVRDDAGAGASSWDNLYFGGIIRDDLLSTEEKSLRSLPDSSSLTVKRINYVSEELLAFDEKISGLRRTQYLQTLLTDSFEFLECRSSEGALVGYSAFLDLGRCFYVLTVMVDTSKFDPLSKDGAYQDNVPIAGLTLLLTHARTAFEANKTGASPKPLLVTPLRGTPFARELYSLLTRIGLHYMFSAAKFLVEPPAVEVGNDVNKDCNGAKPVMKGATLAQWHWQKPPASIVVGPYGNLVSF